MSSFDPELEELGALGATQQPKGAYSLGSPSVLHVETRRSQSGEPLHGRCRAPYSPPAQLARVRNTPRLALAKETQLTQARSAPQLALMLVTQLARVRILRNWRRQKKHGGCG